jgi:hypothetical protein
MPCHARVYGFLAQFHAAGLREICFVDCLRVGGCGLWSVSVFRCSARRGFSVQLCTTVILLGHKNVADPKMLWACCRLLLTTPQFEPFVTLRGDV